MALETHAIHGLRAGASRWVIIAAVLATCGMTGCYQRVTRATGFGADQYQVSEPYQRNSAVDDWIFGKQEQSAPSGSRIPPTPQRN